MKVLDTVIYRSYDQHMPSMPPLHALDSEGYPLNLQHTKKYMLTWSILLELLTLHGEL